MGVKMRGDDADGAMERWFTHALSTKRRTRRTNCSPYGNPPAGVLQSASKRRQRAVLRKQRFGEGLDTYQQEQAIEPQAATQARGLPSIQTGSGSKRATPDQTVRIYPASAENNRGKDISRGAVSPGNNVGSGNGGVDGDRMGASELAAKKMLLPYIEKLSFIEIALAQRGNLSSETLAPTNQSASEAVSQFQSSYLYEEGQNSLGKAVARALGKSAAPLPPSHRGKPQFIKSPKYATTTRDAGDVTGRIGTSTTGDSAVHDDQSLRASGGEMTHRSLGKQGRCELKANGDRNGEQRNVHFRSLPPTPPRMGDEPANHADIQTVRKRGRSPTERKADVAAVLRRFQDNSMMITALKRTVKHEVIVHVKLVTGFHLNPQKLKLKLDAAGQPENNNSRHKRYPQFCEAMAITASSVAGLQVRPHPPSWVLRLSENVLEDLKAEAEIAEGAARAKRNAQRATAGAAVRAAARTTELDRWCLAQAKDLEVQEEGERDDDRYQRRRRRQRRRREELRNAAGGKEVIQQTTGCEGAGISPLRMPLFTAAFLRGRFGVRRVATQAALDLLVGLEDLRASFPELEHFSMALRELHDERALALVLYARGLVERVAGLRLRDIKHRVAQNADRPPLRSEIVQLPHPCLPAGTMQPWITRQGSLSIAFLLLYGEGTRGTGMRNRSGAVLDAKHLVSMMRASWGRNPHQHNEPWAHATQAFDPTGRPASTKAETSEGTDGRGDQKPYADEAMNGGETEGGEEDRKTEAYTATAVIGAADSRQKDGVASEKASIPLHGLLFVLAELYMKIPEDIKEKDDPTGKGGGLCALETLARAVEQDERRQELHSTLEGAMRKLDVLAAEVLRLERRLRSLEERASKASGESSTIDGVAQARVAVTLKNMAHKTQSDVVKTVRAELAETDKQVSAIWDDVMAPAGTRVGASTNAEGIPSSPVTPITQTAFSKGETVGHSAELNGRANLLEDKHSETGFVDDVCNDVGDGRSELSGSASTRVSSHAVGDSAGGSAIPPPLHVKPGVTAEKALRLLRVYVRRLRVTNDNENQAEDINWQQEVEELRIKAAVTLQQTVRRVRRDKAAIKDAREKVAVLRYARQKVAMYALAEEERQAQTAMEILKRQKMQKLREQGAIETILKDAMVREADQRFWRSRSKLYGPVLKAWRIHVRVETRFRCVWRNRLEGCMNDWKAWMVERSRAMESAAIIKRVWMNYHEKCEARRVITTLAQKQARVKAYIIKALGRNIGDKFARWKHFACIMKQVKRMEHTRRRQRRHGLLQRWRAFVVLQKQEKHLAAANVQALVRRVRARSRAEQLKRERWARSVIGRQIQVNLTVVRFGKFRRRMATILSKAEAFRNTRSNAQSAMIMTSWRHFAAKRGMVRKKVTAMAAQDTTRFLRRNMSEWAAYAASMARERRDKAMAEAGHATRLMRAATKMQSLWRAHSARKGFVDRIHDRRATVRIQKRWRGHWTRKKTRTMAELQHGAHALQRVFRGHRVRSRRWSFYVGEAFTAASTGRYERLFWLTDRWPALVYHALANEDGDREGEGILHQACRVAAPRCVQLCLKREADVTRASSLGLTPLHCLGLSRSTTQQQHSTLSAAGHGGSGAVADQLSSCRADYDKRVAKISDALLEAGATADAVDLDGNTPLFTAVTAGCTVLCRKLLAYGADADARNYAGLSALFVAVARNNSPCVEVLLQSGANPNERGEEGSTAMHVAAGNGCAEVISLLLEKGAGVDALDSRGVTPLMYAASGDHGEAAGLLCDYGANMDAVDSYGRTALHVASEDGQISVLREILGRAVDVDSLNAAGDAPLHNAARSDNFEALQALLESGANPHAQDLQGDTAAHIASRNGNLQIVQALVMYDVHIGQRNWKELTPFGEARMNNQIEVAAFLSSSFTKAQLGVIPPAKGTSAVHSGKRDEGGVDAWDKEIDDKAQGWETAWAEEWQSFYYYNVDTWETSFKAPFKTSAARVEKLRSGAEVAYRRKVAAVKGESLLGLSDYRDAFDEEREQLDNRKLKHKAATTIQSAWRVRVARTIAQGFRSQQRSAGVIQRTVRRFLGRRRRERILRMITACVVMQRSFRGHAARKIFRASLHAAQRARDERRLNRLLTRVYRGHLHGRKRARRLRAERDAYCWGPEEWERALYESGGPKAAVNSFSGENSEWTEHRLPGSADVTFFRHAVAGVFTWEKPDEWHARDDHGFHQREQVRKHGFTSEQVEAATLLQKAWRGKTARMHFHLLLRAQRICQGAEHAYLADPDKLRCQINYILFTHVTQKDYQRARLLYAHALQTMEQKGPDLQLLLYAFAIFCFVTRDEDMPAILAIVERANAAQRDPLREAWPPDNYNTRRNPKRFALAEAGFFRFAAYNLNDAESWHNYAACRQLVYGDFDTASEYYLKAIEADPKDPKIQINYQSLMDTFPEESQGSSTYESLSTHQLQQAESGKRRAETASAKFLQRPDVKKAVLNVECAWEHRKQRQIKTYGEYLGPKAVLLREAQDEFLDREGLQPVSSKTWDSLLRNYAGLQINGTDTPVPARSIRRQSLPPPLPIGWEEAEDGSGRPFFFNSAASRSQWERPTTAAADTSEADETTTPLSTDSDEFKQNQCKDATGIVKSTKTLDTEVIQRQRKVADATVTLPAGWEIATDGFGAPFYFSTVTGESRWERPQGNGTSGDHAERDPEYYKKAGQRRSLDTGTAVHPPSRASDEEHSEHAARDHADDPEIDQDGVVHSLPNGWKVIAPDDEGPCYYHELASGLTQWTRPGGVGVVDIWEEYATKDGIPFWSNSATGESRWFSPWS